MAEEWLAEPADGARLVVLYSTGAMLVMERDDARADGRRRWWREHTHGQSGPYVWYRVLDAATHVYALELLGEAPRG